MAIHIACDYFHMATFHYKNTRLRRYLWNFLRAIVQRLCFVYVLPSGIGNFMLYFVCNVSKEEVFRNRSDGVK